MLTENFASMKSRLQLHSMVCYFTGALDALTDTYVHTAALDDSVSSNIFLEKAYDLTTEHYMHVDGFNEVIGEFNQFFEELKAS